MHLTLVSDERTTRNGAAPLSRRGRTRLDPELVAEHAGLRYVSDEQPGITRRRHGKGWTYRDPEGNTIRDREVRRRIEALVIPPAWTDVWICPDPLGHLQVTGRDDRGRKQYRYHTRWREMRDHAKYSRLVVFGQCLPGLRAMLDRHLSLEGLPRRRVLAAAVRLLDHVPIRIGSARYARENESYGLTTMRERHVELVNGGRIRFRFRGKSGKQNHVGIEDDDLARVIQACTELPGWEVFKYFDEAGVKRYITSNDVNEYLCEVSGYDFTAKDFRTWGGTVRMVTALRELGTAPTKKERKTKLVQAVRLVAADLGNTPATCRAFYIHPAVMAAFEEGALHDLLDEIDRQGDPGPDDGLRAEERPVMALLPRVEAEFGLA
ncbi:MAG: DNA topoisomerase IB [Gemmatimonadetes bacterium]|nr:DNA topoisomerase IB [Gemmatimonadota bacterium]